MTPPPFFFTSYAVRRADSSLVAQFHARLQEEVEIKRGRSATHAGFLDAGTLELGVGWRGKLAWALGSTRFLIALLSDDYFDREWCGREWAVMTERVRRAGEPEPVAVLPLFWVPVARELPAEVAMLQYRMPRLGAAYADSCLVDIMRGDRQAYEKFVIELTDYMVESATPPLPELDAETAERFSPAFGLSAASPAAKPRTLQAPAPDAVAPCGRRHEGPAPMSPRERRELIELILESVVCRSREAWDVYMDSIRALVHPEPVNVLSDGGQYRTRVVALVTAALKRPTPAILLAMGDALADQVGETEAEPVLNRVRSAAVEWPGA
ncbi:TIR domain-containing protein [Streptomyces sp. NBC_00986]|uniref:TIR domain-containing protein n=1 Tax=Streptomyces sp. NBC_00986 TaxID=2903702 RepID=UPI0038708AF5|nr:toll/interleukin-1 receptor domain-containing protein [Streptomyces sp. NBC_00986]